MRQTGLSQSREGKNDGYLKNGQFMIKVEGRRRREDKR